MSPKVSPTTKSAARQYLTSTRAEVPDTATIGLTNARTRIVGNRDGVLADGIVSVVRTMRVAGAVLTSWGKRIGSVVTPLGWVLALFVPLAFLFGYSFAWTELIAVGYAGVVLIAIASVYLVGRNAFTITLVLRHRRVVVGEPAEAVISLTNPSRHRVLGVKVEVPVGPGLAEIAMPSLASGATFDDTVSIPTGQRGVMRVGPIRTVRADPIGLVRRELVWTDASELVVHPRTIAIPSTSTGLIRDLEGSPTRDLTNSDISFHALREYVAGDERRYIHWKSTAKTGTYMVRQFEETRRSHLVIALSSASADYATEEEFELAVSVAGSLGVRAIREVRNVSVVTGERTPEFAKRKVLAVKQLSTLTRTRLLDELAVVHHSEAAIAITDVARIAAEQVTGVSVAYLITGSMPSPAQLRAASTTFPLGVDVVAIVCDPEAVPGLRAVSGLSVLTIGYLEDLKKSLSRLAAA
ncbi:MAG: hypothetical protein JWP30_554 [Homoserinimonas sp.]|nr:hypothetical protein [Homoserinimonas sp.]